MVQEAGKETVEANLYEEEKIIEGEEGVERAESRTPPPPPPPPEVPEVDNSDAIIRLSLTRHYYLDAVRFIRVIQEASEHVCQLLCSKNKSEVVAAMDFFKVLHTYEVAKAKVGLHYPLDLYPSRCEYSNCLSGVGWNSHNAETDLDERKPR